VTPAMPAHFFSHVSPISPLGQRKSSRYWFSPNFSYLGLDAKSGGHNELRATNRACCPSWKVKVTEACTHLTVQPQRAFLFYATIPLNASSLLHCQTTWAPAGRAICRQEQQLQPIHNAL
jgi:hypothetical protein